LLMDIPVNKVQEFEKEYLEYLEKNHQDILDTLKQGKITEDIENKLTEVVKKLTVKYKN
jgi:F-type H+-transporting ATPase subunit alpha